jgi:hypothetical protein
MGELCAGSIAPAVDAQPHGLDHCEHRENRVKFVRSTHIGDSLFAIRAICVFECH